MELPFSPSAMQGASTPSTCFNCQRLNSTTFIIIEDDKWRESPLIYVKIYSSVVVLIDTGCGGASRDPDVQLHSLRRFIETYPVAANGSEPLNPSGERDYVVICTHCHYDHIGGIEQFSNDPKCIIFASGYDKSFITDKALLPIHSLCRFVGMQTPQYSVTHWVADGERVSFGSEHLDLGLVIYQTPGHTPDELAIWDEDERALFVGDSVYERAPILFPIEASITLYQQSLTKLILLVKHFNSGGSYWRHASLGNTSSFAGEKQPLIASISSRATMASGHVTSDTDAESFLTESYDFLCRIEQGEIEPRSWRWFRGEEEVRYERGDGKISYAGPRRKFEEFVKERERGCCKIL